MIDSSLTHFFYIYRNMKQKLYYLFTLLFAISIFTACDDDDSANNKIDVPEAVTNAFQAKYPDVAVNSVEWAMKSGYYVAEYHTTANMREVEAWFATDGTWRMTETDNGKDLFLVPTAVSTAFSKSDYATWTIDDIDYYEYPDATKNFYLIEVEKAGQPDTALYFAIDGSLLKTTPADNLTITPDTQM